MVGKFASNARCSCHDPCKTDKLAGQICIITKLDMSVVEILINKRVKNQHIVLSKLDFMLLDIIVLTSIPSKHNAWS